VPIHWINTEGITGYAPYSERPVENVLEPALLARTGVAARRERRRQENARRAYAAALKQTQEELKALIYAEDLMSSPVITIRADEPLAHAGQSFEEHSVHHLPVEDENGALVGILTYRDLFHAMAERLHLYATVVRDVMTRTVLAASPNTEIREIARVMLEEDIHSLPIIDADKRLRGILTGTDILRAVIERNALHLWA